MVMKSYEFGQYTYGLYNPQEYHCYYFKKNNGAIVDINFQTTLNYSPFFDSSTYREYVSKLTNYAIDNVGVFYGFLFFPYDQTPILCLSRTDTEYFIFKSASNDEIMFDGYEYGSNIKLGQYNGLQTENVTFNSNTNSLELGNFDFAYLDETVTNSLFFDYNLANYSDYFVYGPVGMYGSYFELGIDYNSLKTYYFRFGRVSSEYANGYNTGFSEGYENGLEVGHVNGEEVGYQKGYFDGQIASGDGVSTGLGIVNQAFTAFTPIFSLEVLPHITLGVCISIPIIIGLVTIIFKIAKG